MTLTMAMRYTTVILSITLMTVGTAMAQQRLLQLPTAIRVSLDRQYPGWSFPIVSEDVTQLFGAWPSLAGALPHLIKGDFDGDGKADYATLIAHGKLFNSAGEAFERGEKLVVFLRRGRRYQSRMLDDGGFMPDVYIARERRGGKGYSYQTKRALTYENDAIAYCYFEKGATSYIYRKGRFHRVTTGD